MPTNNKCPEIDPNINYPMHKGEPEIRMSFIDWLEACRQTKQYLYLKDLMNYKSAASIYQEEERRRWFMNYVPEPNSPTKQP